MHRAASFDIAFGRRIIATIGTRHATVATITNSARIVVSAVRDGGTISFNGHYSMS